MENKWHDISKEKPVPFEPVLIYDGDRVREAKYDSDWHYWIAFETYQVAYIGTDEAKFWMEMPEFEVE